MKRERFAELLDSVREGGEILRGDQEPSRVFHGEDLKVVEKHPEAVFDVVASATEEFPRQ
ncbi:MAG TPA: hypothetical protein VKM72_02100 [Thermoanaerobaculia bacterium]|nr:hypothetical protein [Thermoanaerobaculia bacterium]